MLSESFFSHFQELRQRAVQCLIAFAAGSFVAWHALEPVIRYIVKPVGRIVFTSPEEAFTARMALAMTGGFLLALPVILYHVWGFFALGMTEKEKSYIKIFGPMSLALFFLGATLGYFVIVPISLQFLLGFSSPWMVPMITVDKYISFLTTIVIATGTIFELPLLIGFLVRIGIATPEFLRQKRPHAYVMILIIAAVLTPPDIVSQLILAVPFVLLYELGIMFSKFSFWGKAL